MHRPPAVTDPRPRPSPLRAVAPPCLGAVLLAALLLLSGCGQASSATPPAGNAAGKHTIVCTVAMIADIVERVAGEHATVEALIGEGVDPHLYKPTRSDLLRLNGADVIFYVGLHLEGKMGDTLVKVARGGKPVYAVTELIDPASLLEPEALAGHYDPHVWMDVQGWMRAVEAVAGALAAIDPSHAASFHANADALLGELRALDAYAKRSIASIPAEQRVMITAHDAFNYFGRAYGIEVLGIQGISTESEAGLKDINRLVALLVERNVRAVFAETSVADKNVRALIEGAASRRHEVVIGGHLFSDAMGAPGTYEGTYVGMIDHNVTTVTRALGGEAPAGGLHGRLQRAAP